MRESKMYARKDNDGNIILTIPAVHIVCNNMVFASKKLTQKGPSMPIPRKTKDEIASYIKAFPLIAKSTVHTILRDYGIDSDDEPDLFEDHENYGSIMYRHGSKAHTDLLFKWLDELGVLAD
jgi:hypothetical protein